jgi:hypothetical protein
MRRRELMATLKDAYRAFWMIKGHLNVSEATVLGTYEGYFRRLWYNEEAYLHAEGFEEAYNKMETRREKGEPMSIPNYNSSVKYLETVIGFYSRRVPSTKKASLEALEIVKQGPPALRLKGHMSMRASYQDFVEEERRLRKLKMETRREKEKENE